MKDLKIQYLYLDLNTCDRCIGTYDVLKETVAELSNVFQLLGYQATVEKIEIETAEMAERHHFVSSPTIKVNGADIFENVSESECGCCSDICGDSVDCRTFSADGVNYNTPTKKMLAEGILRAVFGNIGQNNAAYILPDNLKKFFEGKNNKIKGVLTMKSMEIYEPAMCCSTGLCGVGVNPELLRVATDLNNLKDHGVIVNRYNLNSAPGAFMQNQAVNAEIQKNGTDTLPLIVVDGKIVMTKRYPTDKEFSELLSVPAEFVSTGKAKASGCNCGGKSCC